MHACGKHPMNNKRLLLSSISPLIFLQSKIFGTRVSFVHTFRKPLKYRVYICGWNEEKVFVYHINFTETSFYKSAQFARSGWRMFPKIVDFSDVCAVSMNYHLRYCSPKHFSIFTTVGNSWEFCTGTKTRFGPKQQEIQKHEKPNFSINLWHLVGDFNREKLPKTLRLQIDWSQTRS